MLGQGPKVESGLAAFNELQESMKALNRARLGVNRCLFGTLDIQFPAREIMARL
jgi:hypothetical protein